MGAMLPAKPCLPTRAPSPPPGPDWLHEIKHDGFRMLAVRDGGRVRLISRRGLDWGDRFPAVVAAVDSLALHSCTIDGEVIASNADGLADFELLRYRRRDAAVTLVAFDLLQIDGRDLRDEPIETRKAELARLLTGCSRSRSSSTVPTTIPARSCSSTPASSVARALSASGTARATRAAGRATGSR